MDFLTKRNYKIWAKQLGRIWVDCVKTEQYDKALSVAQHEESFSWMENHSMAARHVAKYITKLDHSPGEESRGRAWFIVGKFNIPDPEWQALSDREEIEVRRVLRGYMKRRSKQIKNVLRFKGRNTFVFIKRETMYRIIDYVDKKLYKTEQAGVLAFPLKNW
ncbi:unnamed protein product, partial [marine sediment metagenome]